MTIFYLDNTWKFRNMQILFTNSWHSLFVFSLLNQLGGSRLLLILHSASSLESSFEGQTTLSRSKALEKLRLVAGFYNCAAFQIPISIETHYFFSYHLLLRFRRRFESNDAWAVVHFHNSALPTGRQSLREPSSDSKCTGDTNWKMNRKPKQVHMYKPILSWHTTSSSLLTDSLPWR